MTAPDITAAMRPAEQRVTAAARALGWDPAVLVLRREARCGCPADWSCTVRDRRTHAVVTAHGATPEAAAQGAVTILRGGAL